ncbi:MAG: hypothetical protein HRU38_08560 [Saccharospirillaceae bacterium]|nr:hypothetical protein [Pseudomonadales bacterium]NRB78705.1 hypothetical protein [Saccharospirillaceae bacterium]
MYDKRLKAYLDKIENNQPINYQVFLSLLPEQLNENIQNLDCATLIKPPRYLLDIQDESILDELRHLCIEPKTRVQATLKGDSHKINTSTSFLLAYHQYSDSIHPDTVLCLSKEIYCLFTNKKRALIVENSELFFTKETLFQKLNEIFDSDWSFENTDIIYGAGNQISNKLNSDFLNRYNNVICFFDYDYGGLKIFKAMKNMLGDKAQFLEPNIKLSPYFVKKPLDTDQFMMTLKTSKELGLISLNKLIATNKCFMEQEAILEFKL